MPFNVTNFSISSPAQVSGGAVPVAETVVSTSTGSSLTLTLANGPYRDLLFQIYTETVSNAGGANIQLRLNGDGNANYDYNRQDNGTFIGVNAGATQINLTTAVPATKHALIGGRISMLRYDRSPGAGMRVDWSGSSDTGAAMKWHSGGGHYINSGAAITSLTGMVSAGGYGLMSIMAWGVQ